MEFFFTARGCSLEAFFHKENSHYWPLTYSMKGFLTASQFQEMNYVPEIAKSVAKPKQASALLQ